MLYAGIGWSETGFEVQVIDDQEEPAFPAEKFAPGRIRDLIGYLRGLPRTPVVVVESTNGVLDGRLMAAGIEVHRADPAVLPARPVFGSVPAADLARVGRRNLRALTKLERARGTQTGREDELEAGFAGNEPAAGELAAQGRWFGHGSRERRQVALTFDDGPQPPYTDLVLDILERYGVPATFFCVGTYAKAHPESLARMAEQGHAIGNHTWSHPFLPELTRPQLIEQIERTGDAIAEASGSKTTLFRPPYGLCSPEVVGWLGELDLTTVLWDVAPDDWMMPGTDFISRLVLDGARSGSVVLLHDSGGDRTQTVGSLPQMIEGLLEREFRFVAVDDLSTAE
ncbi:polysaccharide deacetylase family protein [Amycolatopsis roodepoortensis]|uniref:Peptidoglycan/xylan/chitin deacetylase (PgdA/CDA1 family) n=1 Tax=Amycolatopsis roodepoortensis TaxID=700274 RepID=A0ABR9L2L8_9PSEU|nr:polysaccharide deacetylase family protein [Amycolatopsis roodepoortensis]MBE1574376.1 peptidoglycan/xylan/chitin deacetylase (PgdA/CDA1 family) [Amycolatopsis roodepoortensis]